MSLVKKGHYPWYSDFAWPMSAQWDKLWNSEWLPAVNIAEDEKQYEIELAAPGFHKEDFTVSVDHNMLHVSAEYKDEKEQDQKNYRKREYTYATFQRSIALPEDIKEDEIKANYVNGILHVVVQKRIPVLTAPKKISVG